MRTTVGRGPEVRGRRPVFAFGLGLVLVAVVLGGCMAQPATSQAKSISDLYGVFFAGGVVVALLVWGLATFAALRYRRRGADEALPKQVRGSLTIEAIWTGIPLLTVLGLFVLTLVTLNSVSAVDPRPGVALKVTAFRWGWTFDYVGSGVSLTSVPGDQPEVVVPVGEPVHVTLTAADVNHAFFVPQFLFKRDAIPGHTTTFDFQVVDPGVYPGTCAEFCGVYHSAMGFTIRAVTAAEYATWLASRPSAAGPSVAPTGSASAGSGGSAPPSAGASGAPATPAIPPSVAPSGVPATPAIPPSFAPSGVPATPAIPASVAASGVPATPAIPASVAP